MKKIILFFTMLIISMPIVNAIKPVKVFPTVVRFEGKTHYNADVATCVKAGYRMLPANPITPGGKRVKTETIIQDPDNPIMAKIVREYEDIPEPSPPEILINIASDKVTFQFTTNGIYRGVIWVDAPTTTTTNEVVK